jgi:hypothetical protein
MVGFGEQKIAEDDVVGLPSLLEIGAIVHVKPDQAVKRRALDPAVLPDDHQVADPRQIDRKPCTQGVAMMTGSFL